MRCISSERMRSSFITVGTQAGIMPFFANDRVELFLKTVLEHGYRVLLLDSIAREKLPSEKRLTIDNDPTRFSEEESGKYGYLH